MSNTISDEGIFSLLFSIVFISFLRSLFLKEKAIRIFNVSKNFIQTMGYAITENCTLGSKIFFEPKNDPLPNFFLFWDI